MIRALFIVVLFLCSCNLNKEQNQFEQQAYATPRNITETNVNGEILQNDVDDWRIAPFFLNTVEVFRPAFPNPSNNQTIRLEILVSGIDAVAGLIVYVLRQDRSIIQVYRYPATVLPTGLVQIELDPAVFSLSGSISGAVGVHRLIFYDLQERIITYGDVQIL
jgi:type II secretory pathway component PulC